LIRSFFPDFSLPLTPSRWEGGPLSEIFLFGEKNINNCIICYFLFYLTERKIPLSGSPSQREGVRGREKSGKKLKLYILGFWGDLF